MHPDQPTHSALLKIHLGFSCLFLSLLLLRLLCAHTLGRVLFSFAVKVCGCPSRPQLGRERRDRGKSLLACLTQLLRFCRSVCLA